jgi:uncharacterized protein involved in exopolysaccharide biosynthesis
MKNENLAIVTRNNGHIPDLTDAGTDLPEFEREEAPSGPGLHDFLFMLFRHKRKIIFCAATGLIAAVAADLLIPPEYESEAKLFVRYVVDKSAIDGLDPQIKTPTSQADPIINSEVEILGSLDLLREVAQAVGVERLVPHAGGKATIDKAIKNLSEGLDVSPVKGTSIISVSFKSRDPNLPMPILQELVKRYFDKHLEIHRSAGAFEFVGKETAQLRTELTQTMEELGTLKARAGVISLQETTASLASELGKSQEALDTAEAELAGQQARVKNLEKSIPSGDVNQSDTAIHSASADIVQKYRTVVNAVTQLQQSETDLLSRYTAESRLVKVKQAQIAGFEKQRLDLEKKYPSLLEMVPAGAASSQGSRPDLAAERSSLAAMVSRVEAIRSRVNGLRDRAKLISELGPQIEELERKKDVEETDYKHSEASLEKARIDETLDPSRMPNISIVQTASPAIKVTRDVKKLVFGLAGGGLATGIAIALLIELVLDRTVKRSLDLERQLRIPLLLSIPYFAPTSQRLRLHDLEGDSELAGTENALEVSDEDESGELLRPFCEAIRDRLGIFFEVTNMAHKPKLVAVAGLAKNAGASTLAAGLAAAISDTTEGKVLLVDKPVTPKRFYNMLAGFKSSDLDYVVFDMPSLGDTSSTLPLAGFMDTVLLVVEAEKSNRDAVKRAYAQLAAKTSVSVVFNKSRSYGPKWIEGEL